MKTVDTIVTGCCIWFGVLCFCGQAQNLGQTQESKQASKTHQPIAANGNQAPAPLSKPTNFNFDVEFLKDGGVKLVPRTNTPGQPPRASDPSNTKPTDDRQLTVTVTFLDEPPLIVADTGEAYASIPVHVPILQVLKPKDGQKFVRLCFTVGKNDSAKDITFTRKDIELRHSTSGLFSMLDLLDAEYGVRRGVIRDGAADRQDSGALPPPVVLTGSVETFHIQSTDGRAFEATFCLPTTQSLKDVEFSVAGHKATLEQAEKVWDEQRQGLVDLADGKTITVGAITVKVPARWASYTPAEIDPIRRMFSEVSQQLHEEFPGGSKDPGKSDDVAAFDILNNAGDLIVATLALPPQAKDVMGLLKTSVAQKLEFGAKQGEIREYLGMMTVEGGNLSGFCAKYIGRRGNVEISARVQHKKLKNTLIQLILIAPRAWNEAKAANGVSAILNSIVLTEKY